MNLDDGYQYGLGAFETIAVKKKRPLFLQEHLDRLDIALNFLQIKQTCSKNDVLSFMKEQTKEDFVLKLMISKENKLMTTRENPYSLLPKKKGLTLDFSSIARNSSSPFIFHKTLNYGECILEKRRALTLGYDDFIFLNEHGEICECTSSNLFFVQDGQLFTPALSCGLLNGILRQYICRNYSVKEIPLFPSSIINFEECFVTNSLFGIQSVASIGNFSFLETSASSHLQNTYLKQIEMGEI